MAQQGQIILKGEIKTGRSHLLRGENHKNLLLWEPRAGEAVTVSTTDGKLFRARVTELKGTSARLLVFEECGVVKPSPAITLLQALPDKERMELVIEKTTELGVSRIVPFKSNKAISLGQREAKQRKAHRWGRVALRAARQSRRQSIPELLSYRNFPDALKAVNGELKIMLLEGGGIKPLKEVLKEGHGPGGHGPGGHGPLVSNGGIKEVALIVGPEGGFDAEEVEGAAKAGFIPACLGQRILRTETAAIIGVGIIRYELGG
jgi:16S rRNA (uracil1498-N3)-methyltransferase